jgi:hypothetical protein
VPAITSALTVDNLAKLARLRVEFVAQTAVDYEFVF